MLALSDQCLSVNRPAPASASPTLPNGVTFPQISRRDFPRSASRISWRDGRAGHAPQGEPAGRIAKRAGEAERPHKEGTGHVPLGRSEAMEIRDRFQHGMRVSAIRRRTPVPSGGVMSEVAWE